MTLMVDEIFYSIQGETTSAGFPSLFVRLSGCNLDCSYCDTRHARSGGTSMELDDILRAVEQHPASNHVTITGGEPLLQANTVQLVRELIARRQKVQIETNGSILLKDLPEQARKIVDVKTPSSGEADSFEMRNLKYLTPIDEIKFVVATAEDYEYSADFIRKYLVKKDLTTNISPVFGAMPITELAERILSDDLPARLNLQLHKIIWGTDAKGK